MSWTAACTLDAAPIGIASARVDGNDAAHSTVAAAAIPSIHLRIRLPSSLIGIRRYALRRNAERAASRCYRRRWKQASAELDHSLVVVDDHLESPCGRSAALSRPCEGSPQNSRHAGRVRLLTSTTSDGMKKASHPRSPSPSMPVMRERTWLKPGDQRNNGVLPRGALAAAVQSSWNCRR